jgi:AAA15 family ATPase/GTPase
MLLSFRFANHRSFREEQQLNLSPIYRGDGAAADEELLGAVPVVGIFGANASGKSNVISAFDYMSRMVGESDRESEPGLGLRRQPFRLDPEIAAQPSSYVTDLALNGVRHTYGFIVDDQRIVEEWLYSYPSRRKRTVFERSGQDFNWGEESKRSGIRRLAEIVAPTALFLSVSARFDPHGASETDGRDGALDSLHDTFSWLWQRVSYDRTASSRRIRESSYSRWLINPRRRAGIIELLRAADIGLQDVSVKRTPLGSVNDDANVFTDEIRFIHYGAKDNVMLKVADESSGTLRLLQLAGRAIPILEAGGLFLVDEIDSSLHPLLTASMVHLFQSAKINTYRAQLIFTTHDATLLGPLDGEDVLRRDQVWFTDKDDDGASELFPLAEFKPRRQGENRQKRYLNGSYGAIPELSMRLFEQAVISRMDRDAD